MSWNQESWELKVKRWNSEPLLQIVSTCFSMHAQTTHDISCSSKLLRQVESQVHSFRKNITQLMDGPADSRCHLYQTTCWPNPNPHYLPKYHCTSCLITPSSIRYVWRSKIHSVVETIKRARVAQFRDSIKSFRTFLPGLSWVFAARLLSAILTPAQSLQYRLPYCMRFISSSHEIEAWSLFGLMSILSSFHANTVDTNAELDKWFICSPLGQKSTLPSCQMAVASKSAFWASRIAAFRAAVSLLAIAWIDALAN